MLFWIQARLLSNLLYYPSGEQLLCLLKANLSTLMNHFLPLSCVLFHWFLHAFLWDETTILPPFKHFWQPKYLAQSSTESPFLAGWRSITLPLEHKVWSAWSHCLCQTWAKKANTEICSSGGWEGRWVSHQPNFIMVRGFCSALQKYRTQENIKKKTSLTGLCTS